MRSMMWAIDVKSRRSDAAEDSADCVPDPLSMREKPEIGFAGVACVEPVQRSTGRRVPSPSACGDLRSKRVRKLPMSCERLWITTRGPYGRRRRRAQIGFHFYAIPCGTGSDLKSTWAFAPPRPFESFPGLDARLCIRSSIREFHLPRRKASARARVSTNLAVIGVVVDNAESAPALRRLRRFRSAPSMFRQGGSGPNELLISPSRLGP